MHSSLYLSALQFVSLVVVHSSESKTFRTSAHEDRFVGFFVLAVQAYRFAEYHDRGVTS